MEYLIDSTEESKPEVIVGINVYFHADVLDQPEVRERLEQIRHVIETALADEDNDLRTFVYPEVRLERPKSGGRMIEA